MASSNELYSLPPAVRRIASAFRLVGVITFWVQIVLAVVSTLVLLFATSSLSIRSGATNPGTGIGLLFAILGLVVLYAGAYWAFRYTRLSKQLQTPDTKVRPKRGDAIQAIRIGLIINLLGMLLTLLGAQAIVGALLAKSLAQPQGATIYDPGRLNQLMIQPLDIFIVQANTNTIFAHFVGVLGSLWLVRGMSRQ
jgi:amino acid transporter